MEAKKEYCIGIDVGGTTVKMGLFHKGGALLEKWEIPTRKEENGRYIIGDIAASILEKLSAQGISRGEVIGAGIGVPGPVYPNGYVPVCVNLGWKKCNPTAELGKLLGVPAYVDNDANVAALGEMWKGGGEGYRDVVLLTLGTGVGGGVIVNGKIIGGNRGLGGELGHVVVNPAEEEACNCGNHGCLEQYASATGVVRVMRQLLSRSVRASVLRGRERFSAKDVFDAAKEGDGLALDAVETLGRYLGQVMGAVAQTVDPDVFVLGGGVSRAGQILVDVTQKYLNGYTSISDQKAQVVLAKLGNDAGIYGAAKLTLE